jgi:T-complex protein 1 subunit alpha
VDELGDVTITNDGATILKKLEVEHPAAKVLVELSALQDAEVGDGTTSVVIMAAELLKRANELVKQHVHPTSIISGYQRAKKEACRFIAKEMTKKVSELGPECLVNAALTSMSSKLIGKDGNYFAQMCVDAMQAVATVNQSGQTKHPVKAVNILKIVGGAASDSELIPGFALEESRASTQMPKVVTDAKIALLDFDLRKKPLKFGIQMVIKDPEELQAMRQTEIEAVERKCQLVIDSGANVVLTTGGIDEIAIQYFVERGIIGLRRIPKRKLRIIAKLTGGTLITNLSNMEGTDDLTAAQLGAAQKVEERRVGDRDVTFIMGCSSTAAQTILLRGPNYYMLDEIDRSLHDSLCVVKRVLESKRVVPGGGAVEAALSV